MRALGALFGKSPFEPLKAHAAKVHACVVQVRPLCEAVLAEDWDRVQAIHRDISSLEHEADALKIQIRTTVPKRMFLGVDRGDLMAYLKQQDDMADTAKDLAAILSFRRTVIHPGLRDNFALLLDKVMETCHAQARMAEELVELTEASFSGPEAERVAKAAQDVSQLEREADLVEAELARRVFDLESEIDPVTIMMYMRIFEHLGFLANHAENTADYLHLMIAKA